MKIDINSLKKIAHLARLEFDEKSAKKMTADMTQILNWVEKLNEIDTDSIDPLITMSSEENIMRDDKVGAHLDHEKGLKNAPQRDSDYFRVPKVME